jgi:hypothetical protein
LMMYGVKYRAYWVLLYNRGRKNHASSNSPTLLAMIIMLEGQKNQAS